MSAAKCAQWRRKKIEEDAQEFRAKEALRIRNYRARMKEKSVVPGGLEQDVLTLRDANKLSDDVDTWLNSVVEDPRTRGSPRSESEHVPSFRPTSQSSLPLSSIGNSGDSHNKHNTSRLPISFQDAHIIITNSQKTLQEWNMRWGTTANFTYRLFHGFPEPVKYTHEEIMDLIRDGRGALLELEAIGYVDLDSPRPPNAASLWLEAMRVVEGLNERISLASSVLLLSAQHRK